MSDTPDQPSMFEGDPNRPTVPIIRYALLSEVSLSALIVRDAEQVSPADVAQLAAHMLAYGQLYPVRCRYGADGGIELLAGLLRWKAALLLAEQGHNFPLLIQLEEMTDEQAIRIAFDGTNPGVPVSPIELARWVKRIMDERGLDQTAMAAVLGIDKSNLSRLLDVLRVVELVGDKIDDQRKISRAQAAAVMTISRDADKAEQKKLKQVIDGVEPGSARDVFGEITQAFRPPETGGQDVVGDDDRVIGTVKPTKGGGYVIKLDKHAGEMELSDVMRAVQTAFSRLITG